MDSVPRGMALFILTLEVLEARLPVLTQHPQFSEILHCSAI